MYVDRLAFPRDLPQLRHRSAWHTILAYAAIVLLAMAAIDVLSARGLVLTCPDGVAEACRVAETGR